ncbi:MAG: FtsX-like permease family protein [Candidatus Fermentibacteraceae bacterium]
MSALSWHLAWRYIRRHPERRRLAFSTVVSVSGVALGVAALLVVTSVLAGLGSFIGQSVQTVDAPLTATPAEGPRFLVPPPTVERIRTLHEVGAASPYLEGEAIVRHPGMGLDAGCLVRGVDPGAEFPASGMAGKLVYGDLALRLSDGFPGTVAGLYLAERLRHCAGDTLLFFPPEAFFSPRGMVVGRAVLTGAVETGLPVNDQRIAYLPLEEASRMLAPEGGYSGISIWPAEGVTTDQAAAAVSDLLPPGAVLSSWRERNPDLLASMKLERLGSFLAIALITLVATFNIVGTISRSAVERRSDIAMLKAMGATRSLVAKVFLWEGMLVGGTGAAIGLALGLAGCWVLGSTGLVTLPDVYSFHQHIPVEVDAINVAAVAAVAVGLSTASAAFPALRASGMDPVRGLSG